MDIRKKLSNVSNFLYEGYQYILLLDFHYLEEWKKKKKKKKIMLAQKEDMSMSQVVSCAMFREMNKRYINHAS